MAKIAQKISFGWRTTNGSYIETGRNHGHLPLDLCHQLFTTGPWTIPDPGLV